MDGEASQRPLGLAIRRARMAAGLSQEVAAQRIGKSRRWWLDLENGRVSPRQSELEAIAALLQTTVDALTGPAAGPLERPLHMPHPGLGLPPEQPGDHEYVEAIHATIGHLVGLEVQYGGDDVAPLAARYFTAVRRRLAAGGHPRGLDRDLTAAAGELAEVAGWLAHDADQQEAARQMNVEALYLSRLAGDRSIELLTISNQSFVSLFGRQSGEALMLARSALAGRLTNRQRVIFQLREARALAQLGDHTGALRVAERAASGFQDGSTREDPAWAWWTSNSEVAGHVAWAYIETGQPGRAVSALQRTVEASRPGQVNVAYFRLARFLGATMAAGAWSDAEEVLEMVLPYASEVRSSRTARMLRQGIGLMAPDAPARLVEGGRHLADVLTAAGNSP